MLAHIHPPNFDEVYFASAGVSLANGGPPESWMQTPWRVSSVAQFYGPIWFWLEAYFFRWFGVSLYVGRGLSLAGLLVLAITVAAAIRAGGASRHWAAAGFALAVWVPSLPVIEGRMDTTAHAFGLAGLAAFILAVRQHVASKAGLLAAAGGIAFGLGALTSPRAGLVAVAMALSSPILPVFGFDRRRVGGCVAITTIAAGLTATVGLTLAGVTWIEWIDALRQGTIGTGDASLLLGGIWTSHQASRMAPAPLAFAVIAGIALRRNGPPQVRGMVAFVTAFAALNMLLTASFFGDPFGRTVQFVYCWLIAALLAAGTLLADRQRQVVMALALLALGCVGLRVNRYVEVAQSWAARDPKPVERFLRTHVPPGAMVYSGPAYYFAVHSAGLRVRAYTSRLRLPWYPTGAAGPASPEQPQFLVVPVPDLEATEPPRPGTECATSAPLVATFEPAPVPTTGILARVPVYYQRTATRGYSRTLLFRLPDGCELE
jgi:hypothetical protein